MNIQKPQEIRAAILAALPDASEEVQKKMSDELFAIYSLSRCIINLCDFIEVLRVNIGKRVFAIETACGGPEVIAAAIAAQTGAVPQQGQPPVPPQYAPQQGQMPPQQGQPPMPPQYAPQYAPQAHSTISPGTAAGRPDPAGDGAWVMGGIDPETVRGPSVPPAVAAALGGAPVPHAAPMPAGGPVVPGAPPSAPTAQGNPLPPHVQAALAQQAAMAAAAQQPMPQMPQQPFPGFPGMPPQQAVPQPMPFPGFPTGPATPAAPPIPGAPNGQQGQ